MLLEELKALNINPSHVLGLGKQRMLLLVEAGIHNIYDLLITLPRAYEDRSAIFPLRATFSSEARACKVRVSSHEYIGWGRKRTLKVCVSDGKDSAALLCFGRPALASMLRIDMEIYLWANFNFYKNEWQCSRFEFERVSSNPKIFFKIIPVYSISAKLPYNTFRSLIQYALEQYADKIETEIPQSLIDKNKLIPPRDALRILHMPENIAEIERARRSLAYRELFLLQLGIWYEKQSIPKRKKRELSLELQKRALEEVGFPLTEDQLTALQEINKDLQSEYPMQRLLQGDVGCGKTLVAILAALALCELREQVVLLVPTVLLARQHAKTADKLLCSLDVRTSLVHSALSAQERRNTFADIANGETDLIIGTHTLLSDKIDFHKLGMVIIDEQQRFGVSQRGKLLENNNDLDTLVMTATPIPRTLALSIFGHMSVSTIKTMPPNRQTITSHLARMGKEDKVYSFVEKELERGRQIYFVYPWIEENTEAERKSAEGMLKDLQKRFPNYSVALLHSRVEEETQYQVMQDFYSAKISILVATSVVEVGVDVPNASCIVIEHSERFGLATLHQLRGRVGRGEHPSYAFFVYSDPLSDDARKRLKAIYENSSGFVLAEHDLVIRGPGEFDGLRQAGYLHLDIASLRDDLDLLIQTNKDCLELYKLDPNLQHAYNEKLRTFCLGSENKQGLFT